MAGFNVERFVALTFGLATAGAIGAAIWTANQDSETEGESKSAGSDESKAAEPEMPVRPSAPDVGVPPPTEASKESSDLRPEEPTPPHPAVETPSWE